MLHDQNPLIIPFTYGAHNEHFLNSQRKHIVCPVCKWYFTGGSSNFEKMGEDACNRQIFGLIFLAIKISEASP